MSLWEKYFAPGDLRHRQQQQPPPIPAPATREPPQAKVIVVKPAPPRISPADRTRRQNALLYGGIAFTALSLFVTRRALQRKLVQVQSQSQTSTLPSKSASSTPATATATSGPSEGSKVDGSLEALQALGYATLNVFSVAMLGIGAGMTYFDVADLEDLREGVRKRMGEVDVQESEREIEEWVAEILARKGGTGEMREGVLEKVKEIERARGMEKVEEGRKSG